MGWSLGVVWGPCPLLPTFCFIDHLRYWGGGRIGVAKKGQEVISWGCGAVCGRRLFPAVLRGLKQVLGGLELSVGMKWRGWQGPRGATYVVPRCVCEHSTGPLPGPPLRGYPLLQ